MAEQEKAGPPFAAGENVFVNGKSALIATDTVYDIFGSGFNQILIDGLAIKISVEQITREEKKKGEALEAKDLESWRADLQGFNMIMSSVGAQAADNAREIKALKAKDRDYWRYRFAGQFMAEYAKVTYDTWEHVSAKAVRMADALLAELEKVKK